MLKKIILMGLVFISAVGFAAKDNSAWTNNNYWYLGGSLGLGLYGTNNNNVGTSFDTAIDFGYQWSKWRAFGEVTLFNGTVVRGGGDYLFHLSSKSLAFAGALIGFTNGGNFTYGVQGGYDYKILPQLTLGGMARYNGTFESSYVNSFQLLFTIVYNFPSK